jgi:hypothetical protein
LLAQGSFEPFNSGLRPDSSGIERGVAGVIDVGTFIFPPYDKPPEARRPVSTRRVI